MDSTLVRVGQRRLLVHFPLHLRGTELRPRCERLQDPHRSSRPCPDLLEHHLASDRRVQPTLPRSYFLPETGESTRPPCYSGDQVLQETHSRSPYVEGRTEQGTPLDQDRVHGQSRREDQAVERETEQEIFTLGYQCFTTTNLILHID